MKKRLFTLKYELNKFLLYAIFGFGFGWMFAFAQDVGDLQWIPVVAYAVVA